MPPVFDHLLDGAGDDVRSLSCKFLTGKSSFLFNSLDPGQQKKEYLTETPALLKPRKTSAGFVSA